jgi:predicted dehydrogenase
MGPFSRREFLERSAILSAAIAAGTPLSRATATDEATKNGSANDRLRVAVVGVRGRGMSHVSGFNGRNNCEIVTICDCDEAVIGKAMEAVTKVRGEAPKFEKDFRRVIDDKNIDIVAIATPNHWHALMAVWALRAGKDVYVEKPVSHNVREGRMIVEAARKHGKICQTGTQSRSATGMRQAIEYVLSGKIGKVDLAYGTCYKRRPSIGKVNSEQPIPKTIDYDLWCGPARKLPLMRKNLHYDWHWTWEYGNGDLGNQGIHEMDKARWGLGKNELPTSVVSVGGRFGYEDDGETANTQLCLFGYDDGAHLIFEVRGLPTKDYKGAMVGNIYFGTEGYVVCPNYTSGIAYDNDGKKVAEFKGGGEESHYANFVKAVRNRNYSDLTADILEGHLSSAMCHLGNISYRLGQETTLDKDIAAFTDCKEAQEAFARMKEHLKDNDVDLKETVGRVGVKLKLDPKEERFTSGPAKANDMLFREYRKGFDIREGA